jgi:hypothetical protein
VYSGRWLPSFRRNILPPSSGSFLFDVTTQKNALEVMKICTLNIYLNNLNLLHVYGRQCAVFACAFADVFCA